MVIVKQTPSEGVVVLRVDGRVDTITAPELEQAVKDAAPGARTLVFDLQDVNYISSAGLRVVMATQKNMMAAQGKLIVKNVQKDVMQVFAMTGFTRILAIE